MEAAGPLRYCLSGVHVADLCGMHQGKRYSLFLGQDFLRFREEVGNTSQLCNAGLRLLVAEENILVAERVRARWRRALCAVPEAQAKYAM